MSGSEVARPLPVTVVIPAYNRPAMVARAVTSALAQRPSPPAEVIVVDDCSSDDTGAAAAAAGARVIRHEVNRGESTARNTAFQHARHDWLALLDSDDEWMPHHLASLWPLRDGHVVLGGTAIEIDERGRTQRIRGRGRVSIQRLDSPADLLRTGNALVTSAVLVRRDVVDRVGGFRTDLHHGEDLDLWLRVLEQGTGLVSPTVSVRYGVHSGQQSGDRSANREGHRSVVAQYRGRPWCGDDLLRRADGILDWDTLRADLRAGRRLDAARGAARIVGDPQKSRGLAAALFERAMLRRRSRYQAAKAVPTGGG